MKIGIDLDGTAWKYQYFFKEFILGMQSRGHSVGIVTLHKDLKEKDLILWNKRGFPEPDFYISRNEFELTHDSIRDYKLDICRTFNIDYLFDDLNTEKDIMFLSV